MSLKNKEFWFVVGSQELYGPEVLEAVDRNAREMAEGMDQSGNLPCKLVYKATVKSNDEIVKLIKEANYDDNCQGIVTWCHTFSPSKLWINGLTLLQKPLCHLATQHHKVIPNETIDMDFMNLNQAAHGDREHGFILARMNIPQKIITGYWQDEAVQKQLGSWMRSAYGYLLGRDLNVVRFGDNMRQVAVTEGDKIAAQIRFGWQVNTWAVGDLLQEMDAVTDADIDKQMDAYREVYDIATDQIDNVRYQAREEIAIERFLKARGAQAFSNTFEDLYGMRQLPGLATQDLMAKGFGYGGEGDWKVAATTAVIKQMTEGLPGGSTFMEYYTYHFGEDRDLTLGAHMLEVCPSIAADRPRIETHPLSIGDNPDAPARLVFEGAAGKPLAVSLVQMQNHFRLIVQELEAIKPIMSMPNLPVARVMWEPQPNLKTGLEQWLIAGGSHHTTLTYSATPQMLADWADLCGIEFVHLNASTDSTQLKQQLKLNNLLYR